MHHLHTLRTLIEKLVEGNPVAWTLFVASVIALGVAFVYDLRTARRKVSSATADGGFTSSRHVPGPEARRPTILANGIPFRGDGYSAAASLRSSS